MKRSPMPLRAAPLASTTPLPPGKPLSRGASLRNRPRAAAEGPQRPTKLPAAPRKPPGEFTDAVKLLVRKRAGGGDIFDAACEACGVGLGEKGGEFQHRAARGAGGCRDAVVNGPANAVLLCGSGALRTGCHGACENREPHLAMDAGGFWIEHGTTWEYDPRNVAIMLHGKDGATTYLTEDGRYVTEAPEGAQAA